LLGATADTNVYISAIEFGGLPRQFIDLAHAGIFRLDISEAIEREALRVLRDKFRYSTEELLQVKVNLAEITRRVSPTQSVHAIKSDPSDNRILECAVAAESDFIVSGDARHILPLRSYMGIEIVTVANFLKLLSQP
jgi:putative PIN family toxin of toxin-antitoxin system